MTPADNIVARLMTCGSQDLSKPILSLIGSEGGEQHYTYPELFARALAWAGVYCENGLRQGSHVVVILPHSFDLYASYTGALLVGMIPAMFSFPSPKLSLQEYVKTFSLLLENAHPQMVVTSPQLKELVRQNLKDCLKTTPVCDPSQAEYSKVRESSKKIVYPDPDAIAFLQYSSGTTGIRKGVAITHRALLRQIDSYAQTIGLNSRDSIASWLPLYHDMGLICCYFLPLITSTPIVALSPFDWVRKPVRLFETVTKHRSTLCWLPNFAYHFMANSIRSSDLDAIDLSSLRGIVNCSEPVLPGSHRKFLDRFMGYGLRPEALAASYAMAENTFAVTSGGFTHPLKYDCIDAERLARETLAVPVSPDHPKAKWMASSGMALAGTSIEIQSDTGQRLPDRRVGHIVISSPSLFQGYYRNSAATTASYKAGVLHTGDMGYQTDGHLFVIGRSDDVIIIAGKNIYPQDIEQIVNDIPGVIPGRCVALGISDNEKGTERLVVIAESEEANPPHQSRIRNEIFQRISLRTDCVADHIQIVEPRWLLKTSSGKIARRANAEKYLQRIRQSTKDPDTVVPDDCTPLEGTPQPVNLSSVIQCVRTVVSKRNQQAETIEADQALITSGLVDSLTLVYLVLELEKTFGVTIPPSGLDLAHFETPKRILTMIMNLGGETKAGEDGNRLTVMTLREKKSLQFMERAKGIDLLILGSSKMEHIHPGIAEEVGCRAYNFWVNSSRTEDWYCITRLVLDYNTAKLTDILLGIDIEAFSNAIPVDTRLLYTTQLSRYLDPEDARREKKGNGGAAAAERQHQERFQTVMLQYQHGQVGRNPERNNVDSEYGHRIDAASSPKCDPLQSAPEYTLRLKGFTALSPKRVDYFLRLLQVCRSRDIHMTCFIAPLHRRLHHYVAANTTYAARLEDLRQLLAIHSHPGLQFLETPLVDSFGGIEDDFDDGAHMGKSNSEILLRYLLDSRLSKRIQPSRFTRGVPHEKNNGAGLLV